MKKEEPTWKAPQQPKVKRRCLRCDKKFEARGRHQRLCKSCRDHADSMDDRWVGW